MSFLARLAGTEPYDTWPTMLSAAEQRFWDALTLATSEGQRQTSAVYLFGYSVEMWLKTAFFQFRNLSARQDLMASGGPIATAINDPRWQGRRSGHNLGGWARLLIDERAASGRGFPIAFANDLIYHVTIVEQNWRETLRYKYTAATDAELDDVFASVEWIRANYQTLWR